jgi:hypothetical protein
MGFKYFYYPEKSKGLIWEEKGNLIIMEKKHKKQLNTSNHLQNMVGQPYYKKKPTAKKALDALLDGMARYLGTCWAPVSMDDGYDLIFRQCPGACGSVWKINIEDEYVANWIVNEINQRSPFLNQESKLKPLGLNEEGLKRFYKERNLKH